MYRKILITTDGSAVSSKTACAGVQFAEQLGRKCWCCLWHPSTSTRFTWKSFRPATPAKTNTAPPCSARARAHAGCGEACQQHGLPCRSHDRVPRTAALKIVDVAQQHGCDLIFMGSHGRSGWGQLLLGSVTNKVLHTRIRCWYTG
jgi:nucleotide-binding universal stress UspA family protein